MTSPSSHARTAPIAALEAEGRFLEAIDALTRRNRLRRDASNERRLVHLRHAAHDELVGDGGPIPSPWPDTPVEAPAPDEGLPVVDARELTAARLRRGILRHGCLHVRGLVPPHRVEKLADDIDRAIAAHDAHFDDGVPRTETTPWWDPFRPAKGYTVGGTRRWVRDSGGVWTVESPRGLFDVLDALDAAGLHSVASDYLGERPAFSLGKSTLRRVPLDAGTDWHQDGAFLGRGIRALNVWLALTRCGDDAPGLDLLPRRLPGVLETGTEGAMFDWAVSPAMVEAAGQGVPVLRPIFEAGDVLLFDELLAHRTAVSPEMTRERHAVEHWFFAPSVYPSDQIPLVW